MPKNTGLVMRSRSESKLGKAVTSFFSEQQHDGYDLVVNIKKYVYVDPAGKSRDSHLITVSLKDLSTPMPAEMLTTPFGVLCLSCRTSDYIRDDYVGEGFNRVYAGCTCTRCGLGTLN